MGLLKIRNSRDKEDMVKKIYRRLFTCFMLLMFWTGSVFAAGKLTKLEGDFKVGPAIILILILVSFIVIGFFNRAKDTTTYWAAGRKISPFGAGAAIASNWMSAASFLGMAAIMYGAGYHGLVYIAGSTAGRRSSYGFSVNCATN